MLYRITVFLSLIALFYAGYYWFDPSISSGVIQVKTTTVREKAVIEHFETLGNLAITQDSPSTQTLKVEYSLPLRFINRLKLGQRVHILCDAFPEQHYEGQVNFINHAVIKKSQTIAVSAIIKDPSKLSPGLFVRVSHELDKEKKRLFIPDESLISTSKDQRVFVLRHGRATSVHIHTGAHYQSMTEVNQGLKAGDIVIISGQEQLKEGSLVEQLHL